MVRAPKEDRTQQVSLFMRYVWFYVMFFAILLLIASFGLIAEA